MISRLLLALCFPVLLSAQAADLVAHITTGPYDDEDRLDVVVEVETRAPLHASDGITLDILGSFIEESWQADLNMNCVHQGNNWLRCSVAQMPAGSRARVSFRGLPWHSGRMRFVLANLEWRERGLRPERRSWRKDVFEFVHELTVTNTGDRGPGSLRQTIEDARQLCAGYDTPCRIRFDLGPAAVIRPLTPLPPVEGFSLTMDGESRVTLDGSLLQVPANGLVLGGLGTSVIVRGLAVQSFPENGIECTAGQEARIEHCVITGNGSRGVVATGTGSVHVSDTVLSGNGRSGAFFAGGYGVVERNLIGIASDGVTPMPNGASGIFAGSDAVTIQDNVIAHNGHWGVAMPLDNRDVDVGRNRIFGNRAGQLDVGLDGPSIFPRAPATIFAYVAPNGPTLHSATYDPSTDRTTVKGRLENVEFQYFLTYELQFWSTTAANEADRYLGGIHIGQAGFTVSFPGDLRGRFVTANTIRWVHDEITYRGTSELTSPIEVR